MCLTLSKKFYFILLFWVRYKITHRIESNSKSKTSSSKTILELEESSNHNFWNSLCISSMSRLMQSSNALQSITENVLYSNVHANRRSFMFNIMLITNDSQPKDSIFIDILKDLIFWITNDSNRVRKMIQQIRDEIKKMNKEYNEQCDIIDEFQNERKILQKRIAILKNDKLNDKYIIRALRDKLKILETAQNQIRNARDLITSSFVSSFVNRIAEMIANINASNRLEKTKRSVVISNSTIFIENEAKFEHWLAIMQNKLKANEYWYFIEKMIMTYVSTKLNEKTYKHISTRLNKNFARRYLIVKEMFDDLKKIYADSNKMQTTMNVFTRLTQIDKYAKFHVFWNEFQRLMKEMNLSKHFLLIELKRKMFYKLQDVMSSKFNIVQNIYELIRLTQLKENHYKRIDDAKSRRRSNAVVTIEIETKAAISRTMSIITISISINEKVEQISAETIIWNLNQFRISTSRVISRTFNLDAIKEKLMKANKCFNCDESNHFSRDCSKLRKFRIAEINVRNDTKNSKKK